MKKRLLSIFIGLLIAAALIWAFKRSRQGPERKPPPAKTAEQILQDRATHAAASLQTRLGKLVTSKDWNTISSEYSPQKQFLEYAEVIRALYITSSMKNFTLKEQNKLLGLALETFTKMDKKSHSKAGLLITQIQRLPPAPHDSAEYKTLTRWLKDKDNPLFQKIAIQKLVLQDGAPDPKHVLQYTSGFKSDFLSTMNRSDYIAMADEIRSSKARKTVMNTLLQEFKTIEKDARPSALIVLSRNLGDIDPAQVRHYTFVFLKGKTPAEFESALRAIPYLHEMKALSPEDRQKIVKRLGDIPPEAKTPYAEVKAQEITRLFSLKN